MSPLKRVSPTGSYSIDLPCELEQEMEERVASYWKPGESVLPQVSSITRVEGPQVSAADRLTARLSEQNLSDVKSVDLVIKACPSVAAASGADVDGCYWLFSYAVWPDLTVLATVSGPPDQIVEARGLGL